MDTKSPRVIHELKKIILSQALTNCCPHCGALIPLGAERCEYCEMPTPKRTLENILRTGGGALVNIISVSELQELVEETRDLLPQIKNQAEVIFRDLEEKARLVAERKIEEVVNEATGRIKERLMRLEAEISHFFISTLSNVRSSALNGIALAVPLSIQKSGIEEYAKLSDESWSSVLEGFPASILGALESSASLRRLGDLLYRASRYDDAIKWYSRAILSIMNPPVSIKGDPKFALGEFIPFGSFSLSLVGFNSDLDVVYSPSKEYGRLGVSNVVLTKGGYSWDPVSNQDSYVSRVIYGSFVEFDKLIASWPYRGLCDVSIFDPLGRRVHFSRGGERTPFISSYYLDAGDFDGDGVSEILSVNYPGGVSLFKPVGRELVELGKFSFGKVCGYSIGDIDGDGSDELVLVSMRGDVRVLKYVISEMRIIYSDEINIDEGIQIVKSNLLSDSMGEEFYLSNNKEVFLLRKFRNEIHLTRISDSPGIAIFPLRVNERKYIGALRRVEGKYLVDLYSVEKILDVLSLDKKISIPIYFQGDPNLNHPPTLCRVELGRSIFNYIVHDADSDGVDEVFLGLDGVTIALDFQE